MSARITIVAIAVFLNEEASLHILSHLLRFTNENSVGNPPIY